MVVTVIMAVDRFVLTSIFFLLGLVIGSFLNVCIYRVPRGESFVLPPSHCPGCGSRIAPADLVPLFSYCWLKGRCRHCGMRISAVYPLVELLTGLIFAAIYLQFGLNAALVKFLFLGAMLLVVAFIDLEHYLIPDRVVLFTLIVGLPLNILAGDLNAISITAGLLLAGASLLAVAVVSRGGVGGGDIKLAALIGFYLGWPGGLLAVFLACMLAGLVGLALLLTRIKGRKDAIPFGPFLASGTLITIFFGNKILSLYFSYL